MSIKFQGKIHNWNEEKGFGFVEPNGGGDRAFVHIKAFKSTSRRPVEGDIVVYNVVVNDKGYRATNIMLINDHKKALKAPKIDPKGQYIPLAMTIMVIFNLSLFALLFFDLLSITIVATYLILDVITYCFYAIDKYAAVKGRWRTAESTLHFLSLAGGWSGALLAQYQLRHKTSKTAFIAVYWATVWLNIIGIFIVHYYIYNVNSP